jgi:predicted AAA+ superfamily ATPase
MVPRKAEGEVAELLRQFPAVAILGPRQVGKTTLARALTQNAKPAPVYLDLEQPEDRAVLSEPKGYLDTQRGRLVVIDEVQRLPALFDVLRGVIDSRRRTGERAGQFLLLGSASRELLRQSSESLAGRIAYRELTGFRVDEKTGLSPSGLWLRGGFPESALAASGAQSMRWRRNFITTYVERDLLLAGLRTPVETLRRLWTMLAHLQGTVVNASQVAGSLGISAKTASHHIDLLADLMLARRLQPWFANVGKRLVKSPKVYWRDSGVVHALLGVETSEQLLAHPVAGQSWEGVVIEQLAAAMGERGALWFYRTAAGAEIDLLVERPGGGLWAFEIKRASAPTIEKGFHIACDDLKPARRFVIHGGDKRFPMAQGVEALSLIDAMREISENAESA